MRFNILLIGDNCIDEYQYGTVDRISPEAPVPIFKYSRSVNKLGMAANVKKNLEALDCYVEFVTFLPSPSRKIRLVDERTNHHIARIDIEEQVKPCSRDSYIHLFELGKYDAVVISDYNKGFITYDLVRDIRKLHSGPIFIDTKKPDLKQFENCFIKINEDEYNKSTSMYSENSHLIVTRGSKPVQLFYDNRHGQVKKEFEVPKMEVIDVCGAGDTFLASLAYFYLLLDEDDISEAIDFAISAATVTIQHFGVYAPSFEEINAP